MEKKKPLGEETKDQALAIFIEKHTRAMNVLRELTLATERVVRGTNPDWDPLFEEADAVLGRNSEECVQCNRTPADSEPPIPPITNTMAEGGVSPHALHDKWMAKQVSDLQEAERAFLDREKAFEARMRKFLLEESVLHQRQEALLDLVDDYPVDDVPNAGAAFKAVLTKIVTEDRARPSPDYRMLLVKTHDVLAKAHGTLSANQLDDVDFSALRSHLKEAMRLTNIVHLPLTGFGAGPIEGVALKHVIDELRSELEEHLRAGDAGISLDDVWLDETLRHLNLARTEPDKYLAERGVQRYEP